MSERFKMIGGVLNIILRENQVLMLLRQNKFDTNLYSLPGGCLEHGETVISGAIREIKEETNLDVSAENIKVVSSMHRITPWDWHSTEFVLVCKKFSGTPQIMESDKCSDLHWFNLDNLPENISLYAKQAINNYINNESFTEINF